MRTARPLVTCRRITLFRPSATSLSISSPRLIGPGCMTRMSGLARLTRSAVRPKYREYSRTDGKGFLPSRSNWIRSMLITSTFSMTSSRL